MKKWLVGLIAASLCAASAWAASYTWVKSADALTEGNYVIVAGQGDSAMKNVPDSSQRISAEAVTVTDGVISEPDAFLVWTLAKSGDGWTISSETSAGTVYAAAPSKAENKSRLLSAPDGNYTLWSFANSTDADLIAVQSLQYTDRFLQKNNSGLYFCCYAGTQKDVRFFKEDSGEFSVALDPSAGFEVVEGAEAAVTATPKNAQGDVTYAWTVDGVPAETDGNVLALSTGALGEHVVVCVATDGGAEGVTAEATVSYTVVAAPQAYTVTVADGIENGDVEVYDGETKLDSPAEVLEGTTLTVVANPAAGYKTVAITVNGTPLEGNTFVVAGDAAVTATFEAYTGTVYALVESMDDFEAGADYLIVAVSSDYTSAMKNEYVSGSTVRIAVDETISIVDGAVETEDDSIVWRIAAGSEGKYTLYNAAAGVYVSAPSLESANEAQLVEDGTADAAQWTIAFTNGDAKATIGSIYENKSLQRNSNSSNKYFANYKGGAKPYLFKKVGTGVFSITLDPAGDFDVIQDEEASIAATPKNAVGEVTYAWTVDGVAAETDGPVLALSTGALGEHVVVCVATDGGAEGAIAEASVKYTVVAAPALYTVTVADGIENGSVALNLDGFPIEPPIELLAGTEVTVEATPDAGFALEAITVNGTPLIEGNTFVVEGDSEVSATFVESSVKFATYTVASKSAVDTTGEVPEGSVATFECDGYSATQLTGGTRMTLTLSGYNGATLKGLTLSMHSNGKSGAGSLSVTCNDAWIGGIDEASFSDATWNGSFSGNWVDIVVPVTGTTIDGDVVITLDASANSLYCQSFTIEYEPAATGFEVALDPAEDFDVIQGEEASVAATAKNAAGEVTYAWTVDGVAAETDGPVLALSTGEVGGPHEVVCVATDGGAEGVTAEASVKYTVVAAPVPYTVTVADGIENGTVALNLDGTPIETPINLLAGTEVTVDATPADGYELEAITVNGTLIEGTTFVVAGDSEVSATFTAVVDYATLPFLAEDTPFTGPWQNPKVAGVTVDGLGTDYNSGDGRGAKFDTAGDWLQIKFDGTPGTLSYALKGNGTTNTCVFKVQESATGEEESWSTLATYPSEETPLASTKTEFSNELKADSRYVRFLYEVRGAGNVALYDVYISSRAFSVDFDKEDGFEVEQGTQDSITATVKNGEEPCYFMWSCEQAAALNAEDEGLDTLVIPATLETGDYTVVLDVFDAQGETASKTISFSVVEPAAKYPVSIAVGILNGNVESDVLEAAEGDTVTLTATPDPGFKLEAITVAYGEETLEFTTSPATFVMPASEVLVGASFVESHDEIYVPVESEAEFEAGGDYLIVAHKDGTFTDALKNAANGTRIGVDAVTIEADGYVKTDNADIVWKIQAGAEEGQYVLFNEAASVYAAATKNDNLAQLLEDGTDPLAQWTLDLSALPAVKIVSVSYTNRCLQRNNSTAYFATYTGTQTTPMLFKKASSLEFAVDVDKTGFELALGEGTTVTATARYGVGNVTYVWTSETGALNGEGPELAIPDTLVEGAYSATVTATDSSAEPQTATAEVAFTVVAPLPVYTVTVAEGIENGTVTVDKTEAEQGETVTVTATPADNYKLVAILVNGSPIEGNTFEIAGDSLVSAEFAEIVKYPVIIADGILNGTVEADKEEAAAGELVTLTATPEDGFKLGSISVNGTPLEGNTFTMPEGDALVTASFVERVMTTYERVDSADGFEPGAEYLIVAHKADGFTSAMKNEANGDRIGLEEVEFATETTIETDSDAIVWVIQAGAEEGQYTLFNAAGVYAAAKSDGNYAQLVADGTDALAQWTLDLTALPEVKITSVSYPSRWLQRNTTPNNKYFAAYAGSQTTPALYKKAGFSVGLDKEDGFTVEAGTADGITATALRGTEPYSYAWTGDLEGEGATLAIPGDLAEGEYSVKVTATDSSEPPQTAEKEISFTVVPQVVRFAITVAEGIVGGEVTVDKELAEAGETVTVTATPASGYELVAITLDGEPIEGNTFEMPAQDVVVSATFNEVVDYAVLPFVAPDTAYPGPWQTPEVVGLTHNGLDSDYNDGSAKFKNPGTWMQIKFQGTPGSLSYGIKGNGLSEANVSTFAVLESADGETWTTVAAYASAVDPEAGDSVILLADTKLDEKYTLSEDSRFVRFFYETKGAGNVGIYDVYISEAGAAEPAVTVTGDTTLTLGGTFELALALENFSGEYAWAWEPETVGYVDPDTATFWWTPTAVGETEVTFSAVDGTRTIASETVTLTVAGEPALVFDGDDEGTVGTPVSFTVVAEYVADPAVTFMGFLDVPEGSTLTDEDVIIDFPNVTFTPDVAGDYGLAFSAGTAEGGDYVEDLWIVTVAAAPAEPEVTLVDGETTVELGDDFILEFALSNYEGEFFWIADVGDIDEDGYFTWTPIEAGEFPVVVSAVSGEETIASTTVTLTVTGEPPVPVPAAVKEMVFDTETGTLMLRFEGDGVAVYGTDNLNGEWLPVEGAVIEGDIATVPMTVPFLRVQ